MKPLVKNFPLSNLKKLELGLLQRKNSLSLTYLYFKSTLKWLFDRYLLISITSWQLLGKLKWKDEEKTFRQYKFRSQTSLPRDIVKLLPYRYRTCWTRTAGFTPLTRYPGTALSVQEVMNTYCWIHGTYTIPRQ